MREIYVATMSYSSVIMGFSDLIHALCAQTENLLFFESVMEILLLAFSKSPYYGGINAKDYS